ncbi:zinc-ribbon domain-containing protein [Dechloromonas denitrificans]|uniref:zinc-ribbon domain-containing protein n=1 Tax=Dechloromonas denitrificans TaxID=281362 RepID=UPI001CF898BF|nr:zinc-ribbon domain-containing protein [Dechloromonas denitrificans]
MSISDSKKVQETSPRQKRTPLENHSLAAAYPEIVARHWLPENGDPTLIHSGSGKDLLWRCPEGHTFRRVVWRMIKTQRCNICNSLGYQSERGRLCWHKTMNGAVTPWNVGVGSDFKAWWQCLEHPHHEWRTTVAAFLSSKGCPFCTRDRASPEYNLTTEFPDVGRSWHPTRNGDLQPIDLLPRSDRVVWWHCPAGHEWDAPVKKRTSGHGCPYCSRHRITSETSLQTTHPELATEWDRKKNGSLSPKDFSAGSDCIAWWRCASDPSHSWSARIANRAILQTGCPYCANRLADGSNSLQVLRPDLVAEWDVERNSITPEDVVPGSNRNVWWRCKRGHHWAAAVAARALVGTGCAKCMTQSSLIEIRLFCELRFFFPDAEWMFRVNGIECDIFLPSLGVAVEFDGRYWHKDREKHDLAKNTRLGVHGVKVLRVRQAPLSPIGRHDVVVKTSANHEQIVTATLNALAHSGLVLADEMAQELENAARCGGLRADSQFRSLRCYLKKPIPSRSLAYLYPEIAAEWDFESNAPLLPEMFLPNSGERVMWQCSRNPLHVWRTRIAHRTQSGAGCPYCAGNLPDANNNLATVYPDLARQWHPKMNGDLGPGEVTPRSTKKVWWFCPEDPSHVYEASPYNRSRIQGCPYCAKRRPSPTDNFAVVYPNLAGEFNLTSNNGHRPEDYRPSSGAKIWWRCNSCGTEWQATIASRVRGWNACPKCAPNARPGQRRPRN